MSAAVAYAMMCQEEHSRKIVRILLIDDDDIFNKLLLDRIPDCTFIVTHNCRQAEEYLESRSVDAIILDLNLPQESGFQCLPKLRKRSNAPCVLITAQSVTPELVNAAISTGAVAFLEKPAGYGGTFLPQLRALLHLDRTHGRD